MQAVIIDSFDIWVNAQGIKSRTRIKSVDNISLEGITKLRELILELAVSGRLINQDSSDEPISELLKRVEKNNILLIKKGELRKPKILPQIENHEYPFALPKGWEYIRLNNIGEWGSGATPNRGKTEYYGGKIPWFKSGELVGDYISTAEEFITELALKEASLRYNKVGDVLIAMYGATIGKTSILTIPATTNQAVCACTPFKSISNVYLLTLLKAYKARFIDMGAGGAQPNISREKIIATVIALPPVAEQHRIVAKVNELMALCDRLEEEQFNNLKTHQILVKTLLETLTQAEDPNALQTAWERLAVHFDVLFCTDDSIDQLKQTILQLAVMGKLVKQDPKDEQASELLKKIEKEKDKLVKEKKLKKQKPLLTITDETKPFVIPNSWLWVPWGSVLAYDDFPFKRGPFGSSLKKDMFIESGYKVYEQYCPINDDCSFERYYISDELYKNLEGFAVKAGDYLVSCSGATLGRITQVPDVFKEGIINQALLRVRMNHKYIDKDFFKLLFRSPYFQKMIFDNSTGSAIPNVKGVAELKIMPIPFLPIAEQKKIVKKIEELYIICDSLTEKIMQSQKIKGILSKTIVEKVFQ